MAEVKNERTDMKEVLDCADHSLGVLSGLARLRKAGVLLDTLLLAEGLSFQVNSSVAAYFLRRLEITGECSNCIILKKYIATNLAAKPSFLLWKASLEQKLLVRWLGFMRI